MAASLEALPTPLPSPPFVDLPPTTPASSCEADNLAHDIIRLTPVPTVILDASLIVRHVSDSYRLVSSASSRGDLIGKHADDFFRLSSTLPAYALAPTIVRTAQSTGCLQQVKSVDAGIAWEIRAVPVHRNESLRCIQMEFLNITEAHQRQLELEETLYANETFRILVETVKDYAIFMLDPGGHVATWNAGAQAFKGYTKSEIIGKHFSNFYSKEDQDNDKPGRELRDAIRDGRCEDEGWRLRKDGSRFWANVVITPVYKNDVLLGFSKVTRDLTERRKAENSLISAYEESSKLKSEFLVSA
jgi:osomolarity two-component system sensor histidine kinase TcsA